MRLAWFRPEPDTSGADDGAWLLAELRTAHEIDAFTQANAHEFVWKHVRTPYRLCVHELGSTPSHQFIWPYLFHYGGVLWLRSTGVAESRAHALAREHRAADYRAEVAFGGGWSMLRAPLMASTLVVVPHRATAFALQEQCPDARVRVGPTGVQRLGQVPATEQVQAAGQRQPLRVGVPARDHRETVDRAVRRARASGSACELIVETDLARMLGTADVVLALPWPSCGEPPTVALMAMAAGRPTVVLETDTTADWPVLDPQTWRARGLARVPPIAVSIDPRDEEHSLMLALRRLCADRALRVQLGEAATTWWASHATPRHAADAWQRLLEEAVSLEPLPRPVDWPAHLTADGTERAREILVEFGAEVDFLR